MQGLREAVELIQETAVKAEAVRCFRPSEEAPGTYIMQAPGKDPVKVFADPAPRGYSAFSIAGLCAEIKHFHSENKSAAVFVGRGKIGVHLDEDGRRRDALNMGMPNSEAFKVLREFDQNPKKMNQRQFVWLIRSSLGEPTAPSGFLDGVRNLKFTKSSDGSSTVKVGKESLGNTVIAEVVGNGFPIPEQAIFDIPVYADVLDADGALMTEVVRCVIDVDVDENAFILKPRPGEIDRAQRSMDERICQMLAKELDGVAAVFNGGM